jgi:hypothetical protein
MTLITLLPLVAVAGVVTLLLAAAVGLAVVVVQVGILQTQ